MSHKIIRCTTREEAEATFGSTFRAPSARTQKLERDLEGSLQLGGWPNAPTTMEQPPRGSTYIPVSQSTSVSPRATKLASLSSHFELDNHAPEAAPRRKHPVGPSANPVLAVPKDLRRFQDATHFDIRGPDAGPLRPTTATSTVYGSIAPAPDAERMAANGKRNQAFLTTSFDFHEMAVMPKTYEPIMSRRGYATLQDAGRVDPPSIARERRADVLASTFSLG